MLHDVKVVLVEMGSDLQGIYNYRPEKRSLVTINERLEGTEEFFEVLFKFYALHFQLSQRHSPLPFRAVSFRGEAIQPHENAMAGVNWS